MIAGFRWDNEDDFGAEGGAGRHLPVLPLGALAVVSDWAKL